MPVNIRPEIRQAINDTVLPEDQNFGKAVLPVICAATYENSTWSPLEVKLDTEHPVSPGSTAVQYAQSIFEGMKAYSIDQATPQIFRPYDHAKRFQRSADRMCMPPVPEELFIQAVNLITDLYRDLIPRDHNSSLYIRPALYGDDFSLAIVPSRHYSFTVHVAPTLPFAPGMKSVLIERQDTRAAVGGTGGVKAAGNYAASFKSIERAQALDCATSIWLDPLESKYIEELSLMNFFAVIQGQLHTPKMQDSFLSGLTRDSILKLAAEHNIKVIEERIEMNRLLEQITSGECTEAFSSGTAAVISPIRSFKEVDGKEYVISQEPGTISTQLRSALVGIQEGTHPDTFGWMHDVTS